MDKRWPSVQQVSLYLVEWSQNQRKGAQYIEL